MLIDSHAHLNFKEFDDRWDAVANDCLANDTWVINVGAQLATSKKAIAIAENFPHGMFAAVGLHPIHVAGSKFHPEEFDAEQYGQLIQSSKKVVAVGETGIDFFHDDSNFEHQRSVFSQQIELAKKFDLPLIMHGRNSQDGTKNAYEKIYEIVSHYGYRRGVVHCFGGTVAEAQRFVEFGLSVGFTGIVTFKNAQALRDIAAALPLERILIETDAPYLAPEPFRGKPNQPQYVRYVAETIASVRGVDYGLVAQQTSDNAKKLFGLS